MSIITQSNPNTPSITVANADGSVTVLPGSPLAPYFGFPVLQSRLAKDPYSRKNLDRTLVNETDGGYEYTRPLNRNFKRRDYTLGYSLLPDAEMNILRDFQERVGNTSGIFTWVDPTTNEFCLARLSETMTETYVGFDISYRWNVSFKLRTLKLLSTAYEGYVSATPSGTPSNGQYGQASLSQAIVLSIMGYFVFINGDLLKATDTTIADQGTTLVFNNGMTVVASDNIIVLAYALSNTRVKVPVATASGSPDGGGNYSALTLASALDPTIYAPMMYKNGLFEDSANLTVDPTGLNVALSGGLTVLLTDNVRFLGVSLPGSCTITGAVDGSNTVFTIDRTKETFFLVFVGALLYAPDMYSVSGTTVSFNVAPAASSQIRIYNW